MDPPSLRAELTRGQMVAAAAIRITVGLCDLLPAGHDPARDASGRRS